MIFFGTYSQPQEIMMKSFINLQFLPKLCRQKTFLDEARLCSLVKTQAAKGLITPYLRHLLDPMQSPNIPAVLSPRLSSTKLGQSVPRG